MKIPENVSGQQLTLSWLGVQCAFQKGKEMAAKLSLEAHAGREVTKSNLIATRGALLVKLDLWELVNSPSPGVLLIEGMNEPPVASTLRGHSIGNCGAC